MLTAALNNEKTGMAELSAPVPRPASDPDFAAQVELLLAMRRHLHIAHHIPGRLRLRADAGLLELARQWHGQPVQLDAAVRIIDGFRSARINRVAASAVIEYDPSRVPPAAWHQLLEGDDEQALSVLRVHVPELDPQCGRRS